ncbi:MAG: hypothetical protein WDN69_33210 [Aliidongia sp.]
MRNYLLRLGWAHGDDEIISTAQAIEWFDLSGVGRSPSRLDFAKLDNLNGHYLREADPGRLVGLIASRLVPDGTLTQEQEARLLAGMGGLKARAKTGSNWRKMRHSMLQRGRWPSTRRRRDWPRRRPGAWLQLWATRFAHLEDWSEPSIETEVRKFAESQGVKLGNVAQPLRAALTGSTTSPGIFEVARVLGRDESIARMADFGTLPND